MPLFLLKLKAISVNYGFRKLVQETETGCFIGEATCQVPYYLDVWNMAPNDGNACSNVLEWGASHNVDLPN